MQHNLILAKIAIEKSDEAMKTAYQTLDISLTNTQNRAYYAVFYVVSALAYLDGFVKAIKSHHKLMGQFNKIYIYEKKVFDPSLSKIYKTLLLNREISDYDFTAKNKKDDILKDLDLAKTFIGTVKPYVLQRLDEEKVKN